MVVLTVQIAVNAPERRELVQALLAWRHGARGDAGLHGIRVYEGLEMPSGLCAIGEWEHAADLETHVRGAGFGVLLGALDVLGSQAMFSIAQQADGNAAETIRAWRRPAGPSPPNDLIQFNRTQEKCT